MASYAIPITPGYRVTLKDTAPDEFRDAAEQGSLDVLALMSHDPGGALPISHYLVTGPGLAHPRWIQGRAVASFETPRT